MIQGKGILRGLGKRFEGEKMIHGTQVLNLQRINIILNIIMYTMVGNTM